jgi:hypothetical protein
MAPLRYKMKLKFQKKLVAGLHQEKKNIFQQEGYQLDRL